MLEADSALACHSRVWRRVHLQSSSTTLLLTYNMTSLLSLPTELIIQVLTSCPTAQTATCLSAVNKDLRAIWLKHTREILEGIVRLRVPAHKIATALAKTQRSLLPDDEFADAAQLSSADQAPLILHYALLFRNASLASSAIAARNAELASPGDKLAKPESLSR